MNPRIFLMPFRRLPGLWVLLAAVGLVVVTGIGVSRMPRGGMSYWSGSAEGLFLRRMNTQDLIRVFEDIDYKLDPIRTGARDVPRVFVESVPADLDRIEEILLKKSLFIRMMLPLVLKVNETLAAERARLKRILMLERRGEPVPPQDEVWLESLAARYKTEPGREEALLKRVDEISPALCIAQAIEESGWGSSRFARQGNALFGEWTWDGTGIIPAGRDSGKTHRIRTFPKVLDAVWSYADNLNTHEAYRAFRSDRAMLREMGQPLSGYRFAGKMHAYSERGIHYIRSIRRLMEANHLKVLDRVNLSAHPPRQKR